MDTEELSATGISAESLKEIAGVNAYPAISMYMPLRTPSIKKPKTQENMIQLKSLERKATRMLSERSAEAYDDALLRPVREAIEREKFLWHSAARGFAYFASPGWSRAVTLPIEPVESVTLDSRFFIKPLVSAVSNLEQFYVLTLDQQGVQLLYGDSGSMRPVTGSDTLPTMSDVLGNYDFEKTLNAAPGARDAVRFGGEPDVQTRLIEFLEELDAAVVNLIGNSLLPVVPVGVEHVVGHYRKITRLQSVTGEYVRGSPSSLDYEQIRSRAWEIVSAERQADREKAVRRLDKVPAEYRLSGVHRVLPAAYEGTVSTLYLDTRREVRGRFSPEQEQVVTSEEDPVADDEDLLDIAVAVTLGAGGEVIDVTETEIPDISDSDPVIGLHR